MSHRIRLFILNHYDLLLIDLLFETAVENVDVLHARSADNIIT